MPPSKMKEGKKNCQASTSTTPSASFSNPSTTIPPSELPEDIIVSILKRLPAKSILRFKCVSKEWLSLLSSSKFISIHHEETSMNPLKHSFIIRSIDEDDYDQMSLLNVNSTPVSLVSPFPVSLGEMDLVGSVNGLVCLSCRPFGQAIMLWNPATNLCKFVTLSKRNLCKTSEEIMQIAVGFGYDSVDDDYMVIRIANIKPKSGLVQDAPLRSRAEVYSASLDSWKRVKIDFPFAVSVTRSNVIAKGIPHWVAFTYQVNSQSKFDEILVYYDMRSESFNHVTLPKLAAYERVGARFVEWKGDLGIIVFSPRDGEDFVDILVYDEMGMRWTKIGRHGPIGMKMERHMQCSKDGLILAEIEEGKLMLYDPLTNGIKTFCILEARKRSFEASSYSESLVTFKEMKQVKEQDKKKDSFEAEDSMLMTIIRELERLHASFLSFLNFA